MSVFNEFISISIEMKILVKITLLILMFDLEQQFIFTLTENNTANKSNEKCNQIRCRILYIYRIIFCHVPMNHIYIYVHQFARQEQRQSCNGFALSKRTIYLTMMNNQQRQNSNYLYLI